MFYFFLISCNIFFLLFFNSISKFIDIFDLPDQKRKIHKMRVSLLGGFIFLFNISLFISYELIINKTQLFEIFGFGKSFSGYIFFISIILLFIIGCIDDKVKLSAKIRIIFLTLIISINLILNIDLNISQIKLSFASTFSIHGFSFFWTFICFMLFINAFNFFDGINLQIAGLIYSISIFFLYKNIFFDFFLVILIANSFFAYLNYKSKTFLGNNGSFYLPFLFGSFFIIAYNNNDNLVADEIVVLMLIPGLDLLRLFFQRIANKTNPMSADSNHIHHYLIEKLSYAKSVIIVQLLVWVPFFLSQYIGYINYILIFQIICYFVIIAKFKN